GVSDHDPSPGRERAVREHLPPKFLLSADDGDLPAVLRLRGREGGRRGRRLDPPPSPRPAGGGHLYSQLPPRPELVPGACVVAGGRRTVLLALAFRLQLPRRAASGPGLSRDDRG